MKHPSMIPWKSTNSSLKSSWNPLKICVKKFIFSKFAGLLAYSWQLYNQMNSLTGIFRQHFKPPPMLPSCIDLSPHHQILEKIPQHLWETLNNNGISFPFTCGYIVFITSLQAWCSFWGRDFLNGWGTHKLNNLVSQIILQKTFCLILHNWLTDADNKLNNISMLLLNKPKRTWYSTC